MGRREAFRTEDDALSLSLHNVDVIRGYRGYLGVSGRPGI